MYTEPKLWHSLMTRVSDVLIVYLNSQIRADVQVVQLFDSWVGCLGPSDYVQYVKPYSRKVISGIQAGIPVIHFGTGNAALLQHMCEAGGDVMGVDFRMSLTHAWEIIGFDRSVQGNLDPLVLTAGKKLIKERTIRILDEVGGRPGHIFNLGHGILPETPPDHARYLVDSVHEYSQKKNYS